MNENIRQQMTAIFEGFRLPRYQEIPDIGLYLEQVVKYLSDYLTPLTGQPVTGSMISNYVKLKLVSNPVRKQYSREQIAYLMFIAVVKMVLSMEDLKLIISIQKATYDTQRAYDYYCSELENMLEYVFGFKEEPVDVGIDDTDEKLMLRNTIITVAHKVYLTTLFRLTRG